LRKTNGSRQCAVAPRSPFFDPKLTPDQINIKGVLTRFPGAEEANRL
jgi:hypothetical protein